MSNQRHRRGVQAALENFFASKPTPRAGVRGRYGGSRVAGRGGQGLLFADDGLAAKTRDELILKLKPRLAERAKGF